MQSFLNERESNFQQKTNQLKAVKNKSDESIQKKENSINELLSKNIKLKEPGKWRKRIQNERNIAVNEELLKHKSSPKEELDQLLQIKKRLEKDVNDLKATLEKFQ